MKAVQFGAGNIGKGFIGYLLSKSGYELCFVDIAKDMVDKLNNYGEYTVVTLGETREEEVVDNVRAVYSGDLESVVQEIAETDLITSSIGAGNLAKIGPVLIEGFKARKESNQAPMDIIACENALFATDILKKAVYALADEELKAYMDDKVSFPNCTVDRIVPNLGGDHEEALLIYAEEYAEWNIEKEAVKANLDIACANYVDKLDPYLERKLFLLNGAHSVSAYLGQLKGHTYIHDAIDDPEIQAAVVDFQLEISKALAKKHDIDYQVLEKYAGKIRKRFENAYLKDDVIRVGADPLRKLSSRDRLISPLKLCKEMNLPYDGILKAIAVAYLFQAENDRKAGLIQEIIREAGIAKAVEMVSGIPQGDALNEEIAKAYCGLKEAIS